MAKVERLSTDRAVVTILEGLAQGEKRRVEYRWLELWPSSKKLFAGGVSSCKPLENPSAAGHERPMEESPIGASFHVQLVEWGLEHNGLMLPAHSSTFSDRCRVGRLGRSVTSSRTRASMRGCARTTHTHACTRALHSPLLFPLPLPFPYIIIITITIHSSSPPPSSQTASHT